MALKVDSITNAAGSGAPNFPNGIQVSGASPVIKYQFKKLLAPFATANTDVTDLTFNNLTIGKVYKVTYHCVFYYATNGNGDNNVAIRHNGTNIAHAAVRVISGVNPFTQYLSDSLSRIFVASATTVTLRYIGGSSNSYGLQSNYPGDPSTWGELEELPYHQATTDWT